MSLSDKFLRSFNELNLVDFNKAMTEFMQEGFNNIVIPIPPPPFELLNRLTFQFYVSSDSRTDSIFYIQIHVFKNRKQIFICRLFIDLIEENKSEVNIQHVDDPIDANDYHFKMIQADFYRDNISHLSYLKGDAIERATIEEKRFLTEALVTQKTNKTVPYIGRRIMEFAGLRQPGTFVRPQRGQEYPAILNRLFMARGPPPIQYIDDADPMIEQEERAKRRRLRGGLNKFFTL